MTEITPPPSRPVLRAARALGRSIQAQGGGQRPLYMLGGTVVAFDPNFQECDITVHGDDTTVLEGLPYFSELYTPRVGDLVWVFKIGDNPAIFVVMGSDFEQSVGAPSGYKPICRLRSNVDISVAASTDPLPGTQLVFDDVNKDNDGMLSGGGPYIGPHATRDGLYLVEAQILWNDANTVPVDREFRLYAEQGDPPSSFYIDRDVKQYETGTGTHFQSQRLCTVLYMTAGQGVAVWGWQGGTGALSILSDGNESPRLNVLWLGQYGG
jgi:hypothetical protein